MASTAGGFAQQQTTMVFDAFFRLLSRARKAARPRGGLLSPDRDYPNFLPFLEDEDAEWIKWTPHTTEKKRRIKRAIQSFEPVDNKAGKRNERFLKKEALDSYPTAVTHVLLKGGMIEGFFALSSGTAKLTQSDSKPADPDDREIPLPSHQPVAHIAWIGKHKDAQIKGPDLLAQAAGLAMEVVECGQGQLALSLDAFDEPTAQMWADEFGFKRNHDANGRISLWRGLEDPVGYRLNRR